MGRSWLTLQQMQQMCPCLALSGLLSNKVRDCLPLAVCGVACLALHALLLVLCPCCLLPAHAACYNAVLGADLLLALVRGLLLSLTTLQLR